MNKRWADSADIDRWIAYSGICGESWAKCSRYAFGERRTLAQLAELHLRSVNCRPIWYSRVRHKASLIKNRALKQANTSMSHDCPFPVIFLQDLAPFHVYQDDNCQTTV